MASGGYKALALQKAGATAKDLRQAGFTAGKLLTGGFMFFNEFQEPVIGASYLLKDLKEAGYTPAELKKARVTCLKMKEVGFSRDELEGTFVSYHLNKVYGAKN